MAKVKVDTTGVEVDSGAVKPGLYTVKIKEADVREAKSSGEQQLCLIYEISGGEFDKRVLFDYIPLENDAMAFRLAAFQDAVGIPRKGTLDTDKLEGKKVKVRTVVQKSEEYGDQARVRNVMSVKDGGSSSEDLDDDGDDSEEEEVDYEELTLKELKEELDAREIEPEGKLTKKKAIKLLEEDDEAEEDDSEDDDDDDDEAEADSEDESEDEDEDEDEEDDDDDEEEEQDYSEMDLGELKEAAKEKSIKTKGLKKKDLIKALEAADEDDDEEEEEQDYSEMDLKELKDECKERGLKTTGKKADLVKRLEKDDKTGDDGEPF